MNIFYEIQKNRNKFGILIRMHQLCAIL